MKEPEYYNEEYANELEEPIRSSFDGLPDDPMRSSTEIDNKLLTSGYNKTKAIVKIPIFEETEYAIPILDKTGKIKLFEGRPVLKSIKTMKHFTGKYTEKKFPLPVDLHNDAVTSSVLGDHELELVRNIDDFVYDLSLEMCSDSTVDYSSSIQRFAGLKASIVESSKAKGGRMAELSKTNISKADSISREFRTDEGFDEYNKRKNKRGLLGLGIGFL